MVQLPPGQEFLDFVDGHGLVDGAPGAAVLAASVADSAADGREGVVLTDQADGFLISALCRHADVALDRDVGRAGALAGRGASVVAVDLIGISVVGIPSVGSPDVVVGQIVHGIHDLGPVLPAQLLAQPCGAGRADLHALAAGHALFGVHVGPVGGPGHVGGVEELAGAEAVAGAGRAVADAHDPLRTVQVGDLVDIALSLRPFDDLQGLFPGDILGVLAGGDQVFGDIAHADAHVAFDVANALAPDPLGLAAGTDHLAEGVVLVQPVGEIFHADALCLWIDGLFHRNDMHADAGASWRDQLGRQLQGFLGGQIEHGGHFGMLVRQSGMLHHVFAGSHHPLGDPVLDVVVFVIPVLLQDADPEQVVYDLLGLLFRDMVSLRQFFCGQSGAPFLKA